MKNTTSYKRNSPLQLLYQFRYNTRPVIFRRTHIYTCQSNRKHCQTAQTVASKTSAYDSVSVLTCNTEEMGILKLYRTRVKQVELI